VAKGNTKTGRALEQQVADAYRALGAPHVAHDVELGGHQIDVYVELETADHARHRLAVEAKEYAKPVGIEIVSAFAGVVRNLRALHLIDEGVVVSTAGFSRQARNAAREHGLRLLEPQDLAAMASGRAVHPLPLTPPPGLSAPLGRPPGSPFVVGRPLRPDEPIFGRQAGLRFVADQLARFSSVNLIGERRMGKTSLLNHLLGRQPERLPAQPGQPPLLLASLDLQADVADAARFYGLAVCGLLDALSPDRCATANLQNWRAQLHTSPAADYDQLEHLLKRLREADGVCVRPVLVVDEFERLLDPAVRDGFPWPGFFDGLRHLLTADLLALLVASRRPLIDHFTDPARPGSLTSTFPSYLTPFTLDLLDDAAADGLLLQTSDHTLAIKEASEARRWAAGHPCRLQAAGQAWYEAHVGGQPARWAKSRYTEIARQSCAAGSARRR
jgi:hypothetical protein